jgi:hypothetical protein
LSHPPDLQFYHFGSSAEFAGPFWLRFGIKRCAVLRWHRASFGKATKER